MRPKLGILLSNLRAEGGPVLASDLLEVWQERGVEPVVLLLNDDFTDLAPRFAALNVPIEVLGISRIGIADYPDIFVQTWRACRKHRLEGLLSVPTGVHGILFAAAKSAGVRRTVVHVGNYPWHWEPHFPRYRRLMQVATPVTDYVACVTEHVREGLLEHFGGCARLGVTVVHNGIDLHRFKRLDDTIEGEGLIMVGRLESGKDHATLIDAIAQLARKRVFVNLRLVGTGDLEHGLRERAQEFGIAKQIEFLGMRTDIPELLVSASAFVFAVKPEEGLGIALLEAMAAGLPCVASDVGACREVLAGGEAGLLVPPGDADKLADAIEAVLSDAELRSRLRSTAVRRVAEVFDREVMADRYIELLTGGAT